MAKKHVDGKDKDEGILIAAFVMALLFLLSPFLIMVMWDRMGESVTWLAARVRWGEMALFALMTDSAMALFQMVGLVIDSTERMALDNYKAMMDRTGYYTRWLFIPAMLGMGVYAFLKSPREMYSRVHDMKSLVKQESAVWPEIAPVVGKQISLVEQDPTQGEWASAMTEREFAAKHSLITVDAAGKPAVKVDEARLVFAGMLGQPWTSTGALPVHTRALFAAIAMRVGGDATGCTEKLRLMSSTFAAGGIKGMDTSWVDEALAKHLKNKLVQRCIQKHAYVYTVMATMLQIGKTDGVFASPMFIWLKTVDRKLWYTLNNVGRYAFHVECAGIMAHWLFEKTVGVAIPTPMIGKAVEGLDQALKEYRDDDSLDRMFD
ncbi:type IVB secretion system coupling complex protein DotM/IcmP [Hydrogenophaga sp. 2FB]|uniref:type IVB secretion system coupling complex protein DotM/IcmP n=1 Tax=Hydrogenophaga sp. 2FB TaxID=2502187 RepID=UPI0010FA14F8|nr:type IVB secretion system coupling complex protein DotM/IcmP [Hydrogenophaga sp. 2FB]